MNERRAAGGGTGPQGRRAGRTKEASDVQASRRATSSSPHWSRLASSLFYVWRDKLDLTTTEGWLFCHPRGAGHRLRGRHVHLRPDGDEPGRGRLDRGAAAGASRASSSTTRARRPLWLVVRLYVGFQWLEAGYHKLTGSGWAATAARRCKGYWTRRGGPRPQDRHRPDQRRLRLVPRASCSSCSTTTRNTWFAKLIVAGELLVGIGIIVGGLVGIAAFFGALMNMSFMLAGSASTNPVLFFLAVMLMLGWQVAGYYGADRFILPLLGAPWRPGKVFQRGSPVPVPAS